MVLGISFAFTRGLCHGVGSSIESLQLLHMEFQMDITWCITLQIDNDNHSFSINLVIAPILGIVHDGVSMI